MRNREEIKFNLARQTGQNQPYIPTLALRNHNAGSQSFSGLEVDHSSSATPPPAFMCLFFKSTSGGQKNSLEKYHPHYAPRFAPTNPVHRASLKRRELHVVFHGVFCYTNCFRMIIFKCVRRSHKHDELPGSVSKQPPHSTLTHTTSISLARRAHRLGL